MRIPSKLPGKLSIRGGLNPIFTGGRAGYNYAIGGLPFLSAASNQRKIVRQTAPFRKEQTDDQTNPGEQSLAGYWLRSQMSFHSGAGQLYSDPADDNPMSDTRFWRSRNVDVWTRGDLSLLSATVPHTNLNNIGELISITFGNGTPGIAGLRSPNVVFTKAVGQPPVSTTLGTTVYSITTSGGSIFVSANDGLYRMSPVPATPGAALSFTKIYNYTVTLDSEVAWVKERILLGVDQSLYECVPSPVGAPAALPTALYTAKPLGWRWTSISETSPAIYAVGSAGSVSSILKLVLQDDGGIPTLTFGSVAAMLPGGEVAYSVFGYLGEFLAIGTSKGARVGISDADGNLRYGPLLFETAGPVTDFTGRDRWLWCAYQEAGEDIGLARIDLSVQIEDLRFAYATDLCAPGYEDNTNAVAFFGASDVLAFATSAALHEEDETHRAVDGWLQTSRIRFSTLEPKVFRSIRVRGPRLDGSVGLSVVDTAGTITPIYVYGQDQTPGEEDIDIPGPVLRDFLSFRFDLTRNAAGTLGPHMFGWQVKALPGSPRQRMVTLPVWCYDFEKDKHGQRVGGHRTAIRRLQALEALESSGQTVLWQDLDIPAAFDVFIEEMVFEQGDPPSHFQGWGGIIFIRMRVV